VKIPLPFPRARALRPTDGMKPVRWRHGAGRSLPFVFAALVPICTGMPWGRIAAASIEGCRAGTASPTPTLVLVVGALLSLAIFLLLREIGGRPRVDEATDVMLRQHLRQPLTSAQLWLSLLEENPTEKEFVRRAAGEIRRASEMIEVEARRRA